MKVPEWYPIIPQLQHRMVLTLQKQISAPPVQSERGCQIAVINSVPFLDMCRFFMTVLLGFLLPFPPFLKTRKG
jgi:hypothetical protein